MVQRRSVVRRAPATSMGAFFASAAMLSAAALGLAPCARADVVAYLVNVHVRPGYNFPNADAALSYGYGICEKIAAGRGFPQVMADVRADFNTSDDFQASYLISQSVNELCPEQIWVLRTSESEYQFAPGVTFIPQGDRHVVSAADRVCRDDRIRPRAGHAYRTRRQQATQRRRGCQRLYRSAPGRVHERHQDQR